MIQILLVALLSAFSAQAVLLAQMDLYTGSCAGAKTSIPYFLGNTCMVMSDTSSASFNCSSNSLDFYSSTNDCSGALSSSAFTCQDVPTGGVTPPFAFGFSCTDRPANNFILLELGGGCANNEVTDVQFTIVQIINECMAFPSLGSQPTSYYVVTVSGNSLTMKMYADASCQTTPTRSDTITLGSCQAQPSVGTGRLLQSTTVKASLLSGSARVSSVLSTMALAVVLLAVSYINMF